MCVQYDALGKKSSHIQKKGVRHRSRKGGLQIRSLQANIFSITNIF